MQGKRARSHESLCQPHDVFSFLLSVLNGKGALSFSGVVMEVLAIQ